MCVCVCVQSQFGDEENFLNTRRGSTIKKTRKTRAQINGEMMGNCGVVVVVSSVEGKTCAAGGSSAVAEVNEEYLVHPQRNRNRSNRHRKSACCTDAARRMRDVKRSLPATLAAGSRTRSPRIRSGQSCQLRGHHPASGGPVRR